MKSKLLFLMLICLILIGCAPSPYYQLYETKSDDLTAKETGFIFQNDDVEVRYDLWGKYGNSSFLIRNNTDSNIFVDLGKTHLVVNGIARTYFQNSTFIESASIYSAATFGKGFSYYKGSSFLTGNAYSSNSYALGKSSMSFSSSSTTSSQSVKTVASKENTISYQEKRVICIPPNSAKIIKGIIIRDFIYRDCDLLRLPSRKEVTSKTFTSENTPVTIESIISYGFDEMDISDNKTVKNTLWVKAISNMHSQNFFEKRHPEFCGQTYNYDEIDVYKHNAPNRFFIKYGKGKIGFKH